MVQQIRLTREGRKLLRGFRKDYYAYLQEISSYDLKPRFYGVVGKYIYVWSDISSMKTCLFRPFGTMRFDLIPFRDTLLDAAIDENSGIIKCIFPNASWVAFGMIQYRYGKACIQTLLRLVPSHVRNTCLESFCTQNLKLNLAYPHIMSTMQRMIESEQFFIE